MITDKYGQLVYDEKDLCDLYMSNTEISLKNVLTTSNIDINALELNDAPHLIPHIIKEDLSVEEFDSINRENWYIPGEYKDFDIAKFVLDQCKASQ